MKDRFKMVTINNLKKYKKEKCYFCHFPISIVHHIISRANGGPNYKSNLINICPNCHILIHMDICTLKYEPNAGIYYLQGIDDPTFIIRPWKNGTN